MTKFIKSVIAVSIIISALFCMVANADEIEYIEKDGIKYRQLDTGIYFVLLHDCPEGPTTRHLVTVTDDIKASAIIECERLHGRAKEVELKEKDGLKYKEIYLGSQFGYPEYRYEVFLPDCPEGPDKIHTAHSLGKLRAQAILYCDNSHGRSDKIEGSDTNDTNYIHPPVNWSPSEIKMAVDGVQVNFPDQQPMLDASAGRTYIPIRFLAEALGAEVNWDDENKVVKIKNKYIEGEDTNLIYFLKIGSNKIVVAEYHNGGDISTGVSVFYMPENVRPTLEGNRTLIPFRYITELMGSQVYFDNSTNTAYCVKRDLSQYDFDKQGDFIPILNSLIGEYFVDELNKYRAGCGSGPVSLVGDYSDMMTWAAFDQITHPGMYQYYQKYFLGKELHLFSFNRNTDVNSRLQTYEASSKEELDHGVWHLGAYYQYVTTHLPNHPVYAEVKDEHWGIDKGELKYWSLYEENAFAGSPLIIEKVRNLDLSAKLYSELTQLWGLKIKKSPNETFDSNLNLVSGPENGEYKNISIYNEASYRKIAREAILTWSYSSGHDNVMTSNFAKTIGFATVGQYTYMCTLDH